MGNTMMLDAALHYASKGLSVLPLHMVSRGNVCSCGKSDCSSPGKHPLTQNGIKDASCDETQVRAWWGKWPNANIGVVTGKASGIFVIDIDGEVGEDSLAMLETDYGPLPESWQQLTGGGGRHLVFRRPERDRVPNKVRIAPDVDIRGDDGYIVAEPSNHISGNRYYWEADHHPDETELAELPPTWLELLDEAPGFKPVELPAAFPQGERNNLMFKLGASLRAKGLSDAAISAALTAENAARCNPPLPAREVDTIVKSVCRYAPGDAAVLRERSEPVFREADTDLPERMKKKAPVFSSIQPLFDPRDTVFNVYQQADDGKQGLKEINMTLRCVEHDLGLQKQLDLFSKKVGLGTGYYKFENGVVRTATEVISTNSDLYKNRNKNELVLEAALIGMTRALSFLTGGSPDIDVEIGFDDSIIEDTNAKTQTNVSLVTNELRSHVDAIMDVEKCSRKEAEAKYAAIKAENGIDLSQVSAFADGGEVSPGLSKAESITGKSLNGAQTQSLISVIQQLQAGALTEGQAVNVIAAAIAVSKDEARKLIQGVE